MPICVATVGVLSPSAYGSYRICFCDIKIKRHSTTRYPFQRNKIKPQSPYTNTAGSDVGASIFVPWTFIFVSSWLSQSFKRISANSLWFIFSFWVNLIRIFVSWVKVWSKFLSAPGDLFHGSASNNILATSDVIYQEMSSCPLAIMQLSSENIPEIPFQGNDTGYESF